MMKNEISKVVSFVALSVLLSACGGGGGKSGGATPESSNSGSDNSGSDNTGSDNTGSDNTGSDNTGSDNSGADNSGADNSGADNSGAENTGGSNYSLAAPITPLTLEATTILGTKEKAGFSGDIEVVKKEIKQDGKTYESFEYQLKEGVANMNVTDVQRVKSTRFDCPSSNTKLKGKGLVTESYDYKAGTVELKGTNSGFSVDCTYKISPFEETTITGNKSIKSLFRWGKEYEDNHLSMKGSSCPKATPDSTKPDNEKPPTNEELAQIFNEMANCNIEIVKNITVTDGNNKTHKVAQAGSLSFGFLMVLVAGLFRRYNSHG